MDFKTYCDQVAKRTKEKDFVLDILGLTFLLIVILCASFIMTIIALSWSYTPNGEILNTTRGKGPLTETKLK